MCNAMNTLEGGKSSFRNGFEFNYRSVSAPLHTNLDAIDDVCGKCPSQAGGSTLCEENIPVERDYFDGVLEYIKRMLMEEEDLEDSSCMLQESPALQAAEKAFYDALTADDSVITCTTPLNKPVSILSQNNHGGFESDVLLESSMATFQIIGSSSSSENQSGRKFPGEEQNEPNLIQDPTHPGSMLLPKEYTPYGEAEIDKNKENDHPSGLMGKRSHHGGEGGRVEGGRSSKQFAGYTEESEEMEKYDKALLCQVMNPGFYDDLPPHYNESSETRARNKYQYQGSKRGRPRAGEKPINIREFVDLQTLLTKCAQAMADHDNSTAYELLRRIRQHSSPCGDASERLAHCFTNALEARLAGNGAEFYTALTTRRISTADILKAYQVYVTACPFKRMSNLFSNKSIGKLTRKATVIHIIDFGIHYGFQWPCFIQGISLRPGGPPKLRITGIDFPQPGLRPAERVEQTGRRLRNYCKRFNVPFEYNAIAKKWDCIRPEDLKVDKSETLVVSCLYRLEHVTDETMIENSPRDAVLNLIKSINPTVFVHGIVNGKFNSPFFLTRFRDAVFHFSSLFDMFDATVPRGDRERLLFEKAILGRDAMNVIACEGTQRIERPETYKQWQVRNQRAGFMQLPLNQDIMREVKIKVNLRYHQDFLVDEDSNWMLQGWKGRVIYALSCWKPRHD